MPAHPLDGTTICALSTPPGRGGVAVVRISGPSAWSVVDGLCNGRLSDCQPGRAALRTLYDGALPLDEALLLPFRGPRSFTGEDIVECHIHGSPYIAQRLMECLVDAGCRPALPGEFTQRAFLHGKRDLAQAEAIGDLIDADHAGAHRLALQQLGGGFSDEINAFRQALIEYTALMELELDFGEEDVEFADRDGYRSHVTGLLERIAQLLDGFTTGRAIAEGVPVAILGAPNRGKSTLLNALLREDRAIVSDTPGTTRDTLEETLTLEGIRFRFIDTAGLRETADDIEAEGIRRAWSKAAGARFILYLLDARDLTNADDRLRAEKEVQEAAERLHEAAAERGEPTGAMIVLINKTDLTPAPEKWCPPAAEEALAISAEERLGLNALEVRLGRDYRSALAEDRILVTNLRHREALQRTREALQRALDGLNAGLSGDLLAVDHREALEQLGRITGAVTPDDLLDHIFGNFCIGK
ncbi:MAG: tRNA uridine-5-carboxymethylaminomethyl(34) synthesis GTPase MnmE [Flavobacteriales bacterium]|nr:tRNA uridine-5-carboxymethylaminomethyl(34) synthesis GTPase MnmE [Flavobacteriales bacterium]